MFVCHQHPAFTTLYDSSRKGGQQTAGNSVHRRWSALMVQYKNTNSLLPIDVAAPLAVAAASAPVATTFAPAPPNGAPPSAGEASTNNGVLVSAVAAAQHEIAAERDRNRALIADLHRLQGQLAVAMQQPVAPQQGALPQALPGAGGGLNQDTGPLPVTPTNFDEASSPVNPEEAAHDEIGALADDEHIVT